MIENAGVRIVPMGCSCINQFQLQHQFGNATSKTGLFDWTICAPSTTIAVLELESSGQLRNMLADAEAYGLDRGVGHIVHRDIPGLYFWHEDRAAISAVEGRRRLADKLVHLMENVFTTTGPSHFLWSNVQPNLKQAVEGGTTLPWSAFVLSEDVRTGIQTRLGQRFPDAGVSFVTRREDCAEAVLQHGNVHVVDVPRGADYEGAPGLYAPVFAAMRLPDHAAVAVTAA